MPGNDIDQIAETLKSAKKRGQKGTLLLGAGCSVSAGIPTAAGFVRKIKHRYPAAYRNVADKTYASCMRTIGLEEARRLVNETISKAKMNAAHIAVVELVNAGYVDRVLTTNFDPLIFRAFALTNRFPAIYDLCAVTVDSSELGKIPDPAIFHLHGQHTGFKLLHGPTDIAAQRECIKPIIADSANSRPWVVVGYSGEDGSIVELLIDQAPFGSKLYWVGFNHEQPIDAVRRRLIKEGNHAIHIPGWDADRFFEALATKLDCYPPAYIMRPFSHMKEIYSDFAEFPIWKVATHAPQADSTKWGDLEISQSLASQRQNIIEMIVMPKIRKAIEEQESDSEADRILAAHLYSACEFEKLLELKARISAEEMGKDVFHHVFGNAHLGYAQQLRHDAAQEERNRAKSRLLRAALDQAKNSHQMLREADVALLQLYLVYSDLAEATKNAKRVGEYLTAAWDWIRQYAAIPSESIEARQLVGLVLIARAKDGPAAERAACWREASNELKTAIKMGDGDPIAISMLAGTLLMQIPGASEDEIPRLLRQAEQYATEAEEKKAGVGAYNLACVWARGGDEQKCRQWLERSQEYGKLPSREEMMKDKDLASVRDTAWFKELLDSVDGE